MIVFADGRTVWGRGFGAEGSAVGELCFNTAMTGYQEVMTDPSYARQVVAFTFPHIGNVGANEEDVEAGEAHALGCVVREAVTSPSNFRSTQDFPSWMAATGRIGVSGVDTRALTRLVRREGPPSVAFAHDAKGVFDLAALREMAAEWPGLEGMDLAREVSREQLEAWSGGKWELGIGYAPPAGAGGEEAQSAEGEGLYSSDADRPSPLACGESTPPAPAGGGWRLTSSRSIMGQSTASSAIWLQPERASRSFPRASPSRR